MADIYGTNNNDSLYGTLESESIYGYGGDDFLKGWVGFDHLYGGSGNDRYEVANRENLDVIDDSSGNNDYLRLYRQGGPRLTADDWHAIDSDGNGYVDQLAIKNWALINNYFDNTAISNAGTGLIESIEAWTSTFQSSSFDDSYDFDTIRSYVSLNTVLGTSLNDTIQGSVTQETFSGGDGNDVIYARQGNDSLSGGSGNDYLDGGAGNDFMAGNLGDDVYVVDSEYDYVNENENEGYDTVLARTDYSMSINVEKVRLQGSTDIDVFGNDQDNVIIGNSGNNSLYGNDGNDVIDGGLGDDEMNGGLGDDFYYVDSPGDTISERDGNDTVYSTINYTLGNSIEHLRLIGTGDLNATGNNAANKLTGTSGSNTLDGGAGNDVLDGGSGVDTLIGGTGDDWYLIRNSNDVIVENAGEGDVDYAFTYVNYTLSDNIEQLRMYGNTNLTGTGNAGDNALYGNYGNNTINGMDGNDFIDGGAGGDVMRGGLGDDVIVIDSVLDNVIELADEGYDTVLTKANYTMADNIEKLRMQTNANLNATGNELDNVMIGNSGDNTINGGAGADNIVGLGGADTFAFDLGSGLDSIGDFTNGSDLLDVSGWNISDFNDLIITAVGGDTTVAYEADGADMITLQNVGVSDVDAVDFVFAQGFKGFSIR